jgi:hypothetical protein
MPEPTNRQKSLSVTIRTVAEIAGVSTATVQMLTCRTDGEGGRLLLHTSAILAYQ